MFSNLEIDAGHDNLVICDEFLKETKGLTTPLTGFQSASGVRAVDNYISYLLLLKHDPAPRGC